jgi:F-type H+-transporting ATPase subunit delta
MNGASREALAAARERLDALTDSTSVDAAQLADELAAVTALLDREVSLRRVLTDPAQAGEAKAELAQRLLGSQVSGSAVDLVAGMVRSRWSQSRDLVDALEELADTADLTAAQKSGTLDDVEDELFRFSRVVAADGELDRALTDRAVPAEHRGELVRNLLARKAAPSTVGLVEQAVTAPRGLSLAEALENFGKIAADWRSRLVATVTTAVPLGASERDRLAAALARQYGNEIHLNVVVDPQVIGGIRVEVGDELIDGSIAGRLDDARRRLAG